MDHISLHIVTLVGYRPLILHSSIDQNSQEKREGFQPSSCMHSSMYQIWLTGIFVSSDRDVIFPYNMKYMLVKFILISRNYFLFFMVTSLFTCNPQFCIVQSQWLKCVSFLHFRCTTAKVSLSFTQYVGLRGDKQRRLQFAGSNAMYDLDYPKQLEICEHLT